MTASMHAGSPEGRCCRRAVSRKGRDPGAHGEDRKKVDGDGGERERERNRKRKRKRETGDRATSIRELDSLYVQPFVPVHKIEPGGRGSRQPPPENNEEPGVEVCSCSDSGVELAVQHEP